MSQPEITIIDGYVYLDGVKICRYSSGHLVFQDKDKRRSKRRGGRSVQVTLAQLEKELTRGNK